MKHESLVGALCKAGFIPSNSQVNPARWWAGDDNAALSWHRQDGLALGVALCRSLSQGAEPEYYSTIRFAVRALVEAAASKV